MTAYVYRVYDADSRLIYVGASRDAVRRMAMHANRSWWADQAAKVRIKVYPDMESALSAERLAISTENPRWNVLGRWAARHRWTHDDCLDYVRACRGHRLTAATRVHLETVARFYRERFGEPLDISWSDWAASL